MPTSSGVGVFLKTLTMKGFKSFADAAELDMEPGITVVVGPNGSGKSNVVDAIGWVLGAQAPSAVRSQKMDDVIFAGTSKRAALGRAEVSLTIDNSAQLLPIEFTEVTITRTLFRSGDSEYAINGTSCRLLDIQELLSDSGVGRHQHVIISQGQIDGVLNARPEERRLIIEEAAGVLKHRRRKERSERRLLATEGNMQRLQDLLREVRRQLRPLERQADAARRHGDLITELVELKTHVAGRQFSTLRTQLDAVVGRRTNLRGEADALSTELARLDAAVEGSEAELAALGTDDVGDALAEFEALRERARGLLAVLAERLRGVERNREVAVDEGVIANQESEAARLRRELAEATTEADALEPESLELDRLIAQLEGDTADFESRWSGDSGEHDQLTAEVAVVRNSIQAARKGLARGQNEATDAQRRLGAIETRQARLTTEIAELEETEQRALALDQDGVERVRVAKDAATTAEARHEQADTARRSADAGTESWRSRADALGEALASMRNAAGTALLDDLDGVLGTLADLVEVDTGWEAAFEAAAAETLTSVVVRDASTARQALDLLASDGGSGAILALSDDARPTIAPVPDSVRSRVRGRDRSVELLLDRLLSTIAAVDGSWRDALESALAHPDRIFVTRDGDRLSPAGWRIGAAGSGATGAAYEEALVESEAAGERARLATEEHQAAKAALGVATREEREATKALDELRSERANAAQRLEGAHRELVGSEQEAATLVARVAELGSRTAADEQSQAELLERLPQLEAALAEAAARRKDKTEGRTGLESRARELAARRNDLNVRTAGGVERRDFLTQRLREVEARLERHAAERESAQVRRLELDRHHLALERLLSFVEGRLEAIDERLGGLRDQRRLQSDAARAASSVLDRLRSDRRSTETQLVERRELISRAEREEAETKVRLETIIASIRSELDCEPAKAAGTACPPLPEGVTPAARIRELERELRLMGPINPLALEEFDELRERHQFLETQLADVKQSRRELSKVIRAIDEEIVKVFASAYADVADNFTELFETLFPGGQGHLTLTTPDHLLETGIEISARPSGKNVRKLSLLSGGERSLTALAFLFAVFRSRPSPFYVMDEVEAALDDVNLHRFLDLIAEFRSDAQLIVVSHQKRTMEAADCLYGVTMKPGGSSRVVSERVGRRS